MKVVSMLKKENAMNLYVRFMDAMRQELQRAKERDGKGNRVREAVLIPLTTYCNSPDLG